MTRINFLEAEKRN